MRSAAHGSFATVLLLIPILAIPLLAIFGVPQFVPAVPTAGEDPALEASAALDDAPAFAPSSDWDTTDTPAAIAQAHSASPSEAAWHHDDGHTHSSPASFATSTNAASERGQQTTLATAPQSQLASERQQAIYRRQREDGSVMNVAAESPAALGNNITWKSAVDRLTKLEIRNFRLEPGQQVGQFLFICSYTPQHNPRLSYRFEAEADEPLRAVEKVLAQIDTWLAQR